MVSESLINHGVAASPAPYASLKEALHPGPDPAAAGHHGHPADPALSPRTSSWVLDYVGPNDVSIDVGAGGAAGLRVPGGDNAWLNEPLRFRTLVNGRHRALVNDRGAGAGAGGAGYGDDTDGAAAASEPRRASAHYTGGCVRACVCVLLLTCVQLPASLGRPLPAPVTPPLMSAPRAHFAPVLSAPSPTAGRRAHAVPSRPTC